MRIKLQPKRVINLAVRIACHAALAKNSSVRPRCDKVRERNAAWPQLYVAAMAEAHYSKRPRLTPPPKMVSTSDCATPARPVAVSAAAPAADVGAQQHGHGTGASVAAEASGDGYNDAAAHAHADAAAACMRSASTGTDSTATGGDAGGSTTDDAGGGGDSDDDSSGLVSYFGTHLNKDHVVWSSDVDLIPLSSPPLGSPSVSPHTDVRTWAARAASALLSADVVFVTVGAGMSAEAGIPTYRGDDSKYAGGWDPSTIAFGCGLGEEGVSPAIGAQLLSACRVGGGSEEDDVVVGPAQCVGGGDAAELPAETQHASAWAWARSVAVHVEAAHKACAARNGAYEQLRRILLNVGPRKLGGVLCTNIDGLMAAMLRGEGAGWDAVPSNDDGAPHDTDEAMGADAGAGGGKAAPGTGAGRGAGASHHEQDAASVMAAALARVSYAELHGNLCTMQHVTGDPCVMAKMRAHRAAEAAGAGAGTGAGAGAGAGAADEEPLVTWQVTSTDVATSPPGGLRCPRCGAAARPVVSHPSDDPALLRWPDSRAKAMRSIRARAGPKAETAPKSRRRGRGKRRRRKRRPCTVVLEVGAGSSIHSVRTEGELLVAQGSPASLLLRVNPDEEMAPARRTCAVQAGAIEALTALANVLCRDAGGAGPAKAKAKGGRGGGRGSRR